MGAAERQSAGQVVPAAGRHDERRQLAAAEARSIKDDPADLAEIAAIQQDRTALHPPE